jgi:hypothetical protein
MSLELVDARIKITQETNCVLDSIHNQRLESKGLTGNDRE